MFKTIFSKLVAIFISITIIGFSITGAMLYFFLGSFLTNEKADALGQVGEAINGFLGSYVENQDSPIAAFYFSSILERYSTDISSLILITNDKGQIVNSGPAMKNIRREILDNLKDKSGDLIIPDFKQHNKLIASQETVKEIGDFYGVFKDTGYLWLTIEKPFKYKVKGFSADITGVIYLHTPVPEIQKARISVFRFFMISVSAAVLICIILVYIFSRRITKPLKQINNAARVISGGEFRKRLNIKTRDEIGELAKSFNQMGAALQNLEEMRRGFIANVSHELRTPMTSIRGFVEGILDGTIPAKKQEEYLTIVRDETDRLSRLVDDLLDLAKMEAGELNFSFISLNINELIRRCIIKFENHIVGKSIQIEACFEDEEVYVNADVDAIERVLFNLLHNAIKFTPEKGKITINTLSKKEKVLVSIEDNGAGINGDEIDLIWERFYKSDKSRSRDKTGTGLGLAIVRNIINEHNQEIWVESELGKGTKFTFSLDRKTHGKTDI